MNLLFVVKTCLVEIVGSLPVPYLFLDSEFLFY